MAIVVTVMVIVVMVIFVGSRLVTGDWGLVIDEGSDGDCDEFHQDQTGD